METPSYEGKQVYMGLDVHHEFFVASYICDGVRGNIWYGITLGPRCGEALGTPLSRVARYKCSGGRLRIGRSIHFLAYQKNTRGQAK